MSCFLDLSASGLCAGVRPRQAGQRDANTRATHWGQSGAPTRWPPLISAMIRWPSSALLSYTLAESQPVIAVATSGQRRW